MKSEKMFFHAGCALLALSLTAGCRPAEETVMQAEPSAYQKAPALSLHSDYVYLIDGDTGQILMDRNSESMMYPASMTKVMTSIIALEHIPDPEDVVIPVTDEILDGLYEAGANRAGFLPGDEPTALDHIYGDLLPSGADCSRALAFHVAGNEEKFVELMNAKAKELGMEHTHYVNTSGLHEDDHYTTCRDMMTLYQYCMKNPEFMKILSSEDHLSVPVLHYPAGLGMTNFVLMYINQEHPQYAHHYEIPGFIAGKSGYTIEGQYTLVSNADISGMNLILVNGHGYVEPHYPASIEDAATIYNWYRSHYAKITAIEEGESFGTIRVENAFGPDAHVIAAETCIGDFPVDENMHIHVSYPASINYPVKKGDKVGTAEVYDYDRLVKTVDLVISEDKPISTMGRIQNHLYVLTGGRVMLGLAIIILSIATLICFVLLLVLNDREKRRRKRKRRKRNKHRTNAAERMDEMREEPDYPYSPEEMDEMQDYYEAEEEPVMPSDSETPGWTSENGYDPSLYGEPEEKDEDGR